MKNITLVGLILILLAVPTLADPIRINISNDTYAIESAPDGTRGNLFYGYVGTYEGSEESLYFELPTTPVQYIAIISNWTQDSKIYMNNSPNEGYRPYILQYNDSYSELKIMCYISYTCLNPVWVYHTVPFNYITLTWNTRPSNIDFITNLTLINGLTTIGITTASTPTPTPTPAPSPSPTPHVNSTAVPAGIQRENFFNAIWFAVVCIAIMIVVAYNDRK